MDLRKLRDSVARAVAPLHGNHPRRHSMEVPRHLGPAYVVQVSLHLLCIKSMITNVIQPTRT